MEELKKYIKKSIEVYPIQYSGEIEQLGFLCEKGLVYKSINDDNSLITIKTPKGDEPVKVGDYILIGLNGDFAVCKEENFNMLYEESNLDISIESSKIKSFFNTNNIFYILVIIIISLISSIFMITYTSLYRSNINEIVNICYKNQIEEESNKLLAKTKIEADEIIKKANIQAKKEADETFKKEIERITNEKIGER